MEKYTDAIVTGLASFGMSGSVFHGPFLSVSPYFNLKYISERKNKLAAHQYPDIVSLNSFEELLAQPDLELVIINTPNTLHFEQTKMALKAGKHVIVEKPFTITTAEADQLIKLAKELNLVLTVYQNRRLDSDFLTVKKVIRSGLLGRVVEFEAHYDRYRNYVEQHTWKETPGRGSGILYNLGSHMADQVLELFGRPMAVFGDLRTQREGGQVVDNYEIILDYGSLKASIKSSYLVKQLGPRYVVYGESGSFTKYGIDSQEDNLKKGILPNTHDWGAEMPEDYGHLDTLVNGLEVKGRVTSIPGNYMPFYNSVYVAIREGDEPLVTAQSARDTIRILELGMQSHYEKRWLPFS